MDHHTKCVFKASELDGIKASQFEDLRQTERSKKQETDAEKENKGADDKHNLNTELTGMAMALIGNESSRRNEDEDMPTKGKRM